VWLDRTGAEAGALGDAADYGHVALSPDATRVAVSIREPGGYAGDIWIIDARSGTETRLTSDPGDDIAPVWSPDGGRIAFASSRGGDYDLYETASDGTGGDRALAVAPGDQIAYDWTPGGFLMYQTERPGAGAGGHTDLWARRIPGGRAFAFLRSAHRTGFPASSPDGRRYAFVLTDRGSGAQDVYMARFPTYDGRRRVSAEGGAWPRWRADAIFYVDAQNRVVSVPVRFEGRQAVAGAPSRVSDRAVQQGRGSPYDVSADGLRILINTALEESSDETISRRVP
jgi:dipeptidyl aminopeptidase/acylaminoacyl peptidase